LAIQAAKMSPPRVGGVQCGDQAGALGLGEPFSATQQPATVEPLGVGLAAASTT
jgi:hypothetical protein